MCCSCLFQRFLVACAVGHPDSRHPGGDAKTNVVNRVTDHDTVSRSDIEQFRGEQAHFWIGFTVLDHLMTDNRVEQAIETGSSEQLVRGSADFARRDSEAETVATPPSQSVFDVSEDQLGCARQDGFREALAVSAHRVLHCRRLLVCSEEFSEDEIASTRPKAS